MQNIAILAYRVLHWLGKLLLELKKKRQEKGTWVLNLLNNSGTIDEFCFSPDPIFPISPHILILE